MGTPGHATDASRLRLSNPAASACWHIPHLHSPQIAPTCQESSVGTPGDALKDGVGRVRVLYNLQTNARGRVPQPDAAIPSAGQQQPIWTPVDVEEGGHVAPKYAKTLSAFHVPHP